MSSCIFNKTDVDLILDMINEVGYEKLNQREKLILECVSKNDEPLINKLYDYVKDYLYLFKEVNPTNNEENYTNNEEFFKDFITFGQKVKEFQDKYKKIHEYLNYLLTQEEIYMIIQFIMDEYFNVDIETVI